MSKDVVLDLQIRGVSGFWLQRFEKARPKNRWGMLEALMRMHPHSVSFGGIREEASNGSALEEVTDLGEVSAVQGQDVGGIVSEGGEGSTRGGGPDAEV